MPQAQPFPWEHRDGRRDRNEGGRTFWEQSEEWDVNGGKKEGEVDALERDIINDSTEKTQLNQQTDWCCT